MYLILLINNMYMTGDFEVYQSFYFSLIYTGVFNTSVGSHLGQNSSTLNGGDVINLRPNKQRTKKTRNPFSSCSIP